MFSPLKIVTPSQFLNYGGQLITPTLMKEPSECSGAQQLFVNAPKGFSLDVIIPNKSQLGSPLREISNENSCFNSEGERDMESTEESSAKRE